MTSETRFMRSDQHTVNGLTAYKLGSLQSELAVQIDTPETTYAGIFVGIFVYKRSSSGTETNISGAQAVAVVSKSLVNKEVKSASWNCPETVLEPSDAIVVRVKYGYGTPILEANPTFATFITEQLDAMKLSASTWTVYYVLQKRYNPSYTKYIYSFWFGNSGNNSRIENFMWNPSAKGYMNGLVLIG